MPNKPLPSKNPHSMKHGFTMIELLVVIAIIAILVATGVVSFTTAQKKTRDTKRRSDMQDVQKAFEQWYSKNNRYPNSGSDSCVTALSSELPGGFPADPKNTGTYVYNYNTCDANGTSYCICALLESPTSGNSAVSDCSSFGTGAYFCVKSVQ